MLVLVLVGSLVVASPGWAQPAELPDEEPPDEQLLGVECPEFAGAPAAADELTAYQYALACDVDVEVTGLRDVDRQVYATPDGLLSAQVAVEPYQVQDDSGDWEPIDATLVGQGDGSAVAAATVIEVAVGAGGDGPFVTATDPDGASLSLLWPDGGLPAPVLEGAVATYPEVLPDVDLAVQAEAVGFAWVLVVKTPEAAADPALSQIQIGFDTVGLNVVETDGGIDAVNGSGEVVFEAGQAIMWDSSQVGEEQQPAGLGIRSEPDDQRANEPAEPGRIGEVEMSVTGSGIDLVPDAQMLADDSVTFPVYIDPPFTSSRQAWANVYAGAKSKGWTGDSSWPRSGGMRVGLNTWSNCGDGCGLWRSVIRLNVGKLKGKYVHSASVKALQTHTGGCSSYGLQLWRTKAISNGVSWNGVSWLYGSPLQAKSVPSSNTTGNCGSGNSNEWVSFNGAEVKKRVQSAADQRNDTITFGFRSSSEDNRNAWRRIRTSSVRLEVTYYLYPPQPDMRTLNGQGCQTSRSSAPWVTSRHPTMSVRARSQESESVYVRFRVRQQGASSNYYYYRTPNPVAAYSTVNRRISKSLPDGEYNWQARTDSRHTDAVHSGYTSLCYFKVDATKPTTPEVTAPEGPFTEGQDVTIRVSSTDPVVNGVRSGLNRYEYSWNTPVYDRKVTASGATTISRGNASAGRHVLYVRSVDNAGNASNERTHTFFVGRDIPATPMGMWRFEGDLFDDSGHGHDLSLRRGTGPVLGTDRDGRDAAALELDGESCLTGPAPVRTDAAFSVAMWVRMDAPAEAYTKVLAQGGAHSAYQIQHITETNTWSFSVLSEDYKFYSVRGGQARLGQWQHVAGTYDPDAGVVRVYLDGQLTGEQTVDFEPWNGTDVFSVGCLGTGHRLTGAIDGLGIWQGLLTPAQVRAAMKDLPAAAELARWEFRDGGEDSSRYGRDVEIPDHIDAGPDQYHRPNGALNLDGETCLRYPEPIVQTDRSFAVASWVRVDALTDNIAAIASTFAPGSHAGFELWASAYAGGGTDYYLGTQNFAGYWDYPELRWGGWHHVAFSYDVTTDTTTTYLDGELVNSRKNNDNPRARVRLDNPFLIGCSYYAGDDPALHLDGALQDLRLWRGHLTEAEVAALVTGAPAELGAQWRLEGRGDDTSGNGHTLTFEGDTRYNDGYSCDPDSALELSGAGSAATAGPVVATDASFTVSAWVRIDRLDADQTFVSAAGRQTTPFRLQYSSTLQQFGFVMVDSDDKDAPWQRAYGGPTPQGDTWYHLVGVFDLPAGEIRFYLSGRLEATRARPAIPWQTGGPLLLGASGAMDGERWHRLEGAVDDVMVWQGVVPAHVIDQMSPGGPVGLC